MYLEAATEEAWKVYAVPNTLPMSDISNQAGRVAVTEKAMEEILRTQKACDSKRGHLGKILRNLIKLVLQDEETAIQNAR